MHGDVHAVYDPTNVVLSRDVGAQAVDTRPGTAIGLNATRTANPIVYEATTQKERFRSTIDKAENLRLKRALIEHFVD